MQRVPLGSPAKENQSSPAKKGHLYNELINFVKNSGVTLPPAIAKIVTSGTNPESPLKKINSNREVNQESKKLKVQLTDIQFEYKKLEEDFADYKRTSKAEKENMIKKNDENLNKLKNSLQNSNQDGLYNIAKLKQEHQEELTTIKERSTLELQQQKTKIINEYQTKLASQDKLHTRQVVQMKKQHQKVYNEKVRSMEENMEEMRTKYTKEARETAFKHKQTLEDKQRRHDSVRVALESQRKTEEKLHDKTKEEAAKLKEKLLTDLCYQKNVKVHLQQTVQSREKDIRKLKNAIRDKEDQITILMEKTKKQLNQNQSNYQQKVEILTNQQHQRIRKVNEKHIKEIQKFLKKIQKLQSMRIEKETLMAQNYQDLSGQFEKRPSKKQDINQLQKMKWALTRREEDIRKLTKDIKYCNMQLQNKEDLYTRIFRGNSMSRDKRPKEKQQKDHPIIDQKVCKDIIYRRSQTSDIKFLLKVYNGNKNQ